MMMITDQKKDSKEDSDNATIPLDIRDNDDTCSKGVKCSFDNVI